MSDVTNFALFCELDRQNDEFTVPCAYADDLVFTNFAPRTKGSKRMEKDAYLAAGNHVSTNLVVRELELMEWGDRDAFLLLVWTQEALQPARFVFRHVRTHGGRWRLMPDDGDAYANRLVHLYEKYGVEDDS